MMRHIIVVCGLLLSSGAFAQSEKELELAAKKFEEGEVLYRVQEYDKALEAYKASYVLSKAPELLYNIGQCQRLLGKYEEAITSYKSFLRDVPNAPTKKNAESFIAEMESLLASGVTKEGLEKSGKLFIQAEGLYQVQEYQKALDAYKEVYLLSKQPEILYNIGQCQRQLKQYEEAIKSYNLFLKARPDTPQKAQTEERIKESQARLEEERIAKELAAREAASRPTSQIVIQQYNDKKIPTQYFLFGGGGALGVGGLVVGALAFSTARDAKAQSEISIADPDHDINELKRLSEKAENLARISDILVVAGVVTAGVGVVLTFTAKKREAAATLTPSGVNLSINF